MAAGPTQNYDDPTLVGWRPHPVLARLLRIGLAVLPAAVALGVGVLAVRLLPPSRLGISPWLWLALEVAVTAVILAGVGRLAHRLLPLPALLRLTLVLPDRVPSRFAASHRSTSLDALHARVRREAGAAQPDATVLVELVAALGRHDRATFRHSERVQAYAMLIGRELRLGAADTARLGWAALLHDVGKLTVPREVLNKPTTPDADEWAAIAAHAAAGGELAAPLSRWLGPWAAAIDQHHERWDGAGYPRGLAGNRISLAARIVAVADAYDVITSARAYKAPLPRDAARAELARCAGTQFDPEVVRAFLAVGLGELRRATGPFALLSALPGIEVLQGGAVARTVGRTSGAGPTVTAAAPGLATAVVVGAGLAVATPGIMAPAATPSVEVGADDAGAGEDAGAQRTDGTHDADDTDDGATVPDAEAAPLEAVTTPDEDPTDAGEGVTAGPVDEGAPAEGIDPGTPGDAGPGAAPDPAPEPRTPDQPPAAPAPPIAPHDPGPAATDDATRPSGPQLPPNASSNARDAVGRNRAE